MPVEEPCLLRGWVGGVSGCIEVLFVCLYVRDHSDCSAGPEPQWLSCQMWSCSLHELTLLGLEQGGAGAETHRGREEQKAVPAPVYYQLLSYLLGPEMCSPAACPCERG